MLRHIFIITDKYFATDPFTILSVAPRVQMENCGKR